MQMGYYKNNNMRIVVEMSLCKSDYRALTKV